MRVILVGAGRMGSNHARALLAAKVHVVGVVDANLEAAEALAATLGCPAHSDLSLAAAADAAILAVPTSLHARLTKKALAAGLHVLVEKPIAGTVEEAKTMIQEARRYGRVLAVGHVERFNPAAVGLIAATNAEGGPRSMRSKRLSPRPERIQDVGCILDIGIHDIDLALALASRPPLAVCCTGGKPGGGGHEDLATIQLDFGQGLSAVIDLSWRGNERVRSWEIATAAGALHADLLGKTLHRGGPNPKLLTLEPKDALREEHADFLAAAGTGKLPVVDGSAGLAALAVAQAALRSLASGGAPQAPN